MKSFLITFKPATESPERGWPLKELQKLVRRHQSGERFEDDWRFKNRKDVSIGDRVFLLQQGKGGPAIIGYGTVTRPPGTDTRALVQFDSLVDPVTEVLADRNDLHKIPNGERWWRIQASGVLLPRDVAAQLEGLVVDTPPKARGGDTTSNPDWTRDELILALNFYLHHRPNAPGKGSPEIAELSATLNRVGEKLFSSRGPSFRNENGVYMKLMNFRRFDPEYTSGGKVGLSRGAKADKEVWDEFAGDPERCRRVSEAIIAVLKEQADTTWTESETDTAIEEAPEGRLLTRIHVARERNRKLVESKRKQALRKYGRLQCEACNFDFAMQYGERGSGFIECHHTKPVATLTEGQKTRLDDLALVCANCHRMIHHTKDWLSIAALRAMIGQRKKASAASGS